MLDEEGHPIWDYTAVFYKCEDDNKKLSTAPDVSSVDMSDDAMPATSDGDSIGLPSFGFQLRNTYVRIHIMIESSLMSISVPYSDVVASGKEVLVKDMPSEDREYVLTHRATGGQILRGVECIVSQYYIQKTGSSSTKFETEYGHTAILAAKRTIDHDYGT